MVSCKKPGCPKVYHADCLNLTKRPAGRCTAACSTLIEAGPMVPNNSFLFLFLLEGRWECPWHQCDICGKEAASFCEMCPSSYCSKHREGLLFISRLDGKLCCSEHDPCGPEPLEPGEIREYKPDPKGPAPDLTPGLKSGLTSVQTLNPSRIQGLAPALTSGRTSGLTPASNRGLTSSLGMAVLPSASSHSAAAAVGHANKAVRGTSAPPLPAFSIPVPITIPLAPCPAPTSAAALPPPRSSDTSSSPHIYDLPHYSPISSYDEEEEEDDLLGDVEDEDEVERQKSHIHEEEGETVMVGVEYLDDDEEDDDDDDEDEE